MKSCLSFIFRNCRSVRSVRGFPYSAIGEVEYEGARVWQVPKVLKLYRHINGDKRLGKCNVLLLLFGSRRLCYVARKRDQIVGMELFYFNKDDIDRGTIHEGYIGVIPGEQANGVGTSLRSMSIDHLSGCGLLGITCRIDASNVASLRSARKAGFGIETTYRDSRSNEKRHYLVREFGHHLHER